MSSLLSPSPLSSLFKPLPLSLHILTIALTFILARLTTRQRQHCCPCTTMSSSLSSRTLTLALAHPHLRPHPTLILTCARPHPCVPLALPIIIPRPVVRVWVISGMGMGHHPGSWGLPVMNPTGSMEYLPNHRQEVLDHHHCRVPRYFQVGLWEQTQLQQCPVHHLFVLPQANEVWPNSVIHPLNVHSLRLLLYLVSRTRTTFHDPLSSNILSQMLPPCQIPRDCSELPLSMANCLA